MLGGVERWIACTLYVLGKRVVFDDPRTQQREDVVNGQRVFDIPLKVAISDTRKSIAEMNQPSLRTPGAITNGKFIMQNEPVFDGTRIPVATVQRYLAAGYGPAAIIAQFPELTVEDITAAESYKGKTRAA